MNYALIIFGYIIGSIPFGLLLVRIGGYGDIREIGSGNIGATNVLRTGNKILAFLTLIGDSMKGAIAVLIATFYTENITLILLTGLAAIIGHIYPIWLNFKGGKGVSTTLGTLLFAIPFAGGAACITWLACAFTFRISSLSALVAMIAGSTAAYILYGANAGHIAILISLLVFIRHKDNIQRLIKGEEPKIGRNKTEGSKQE